MAQGNTIELVGNITRDPELRFTPGGQAVASFGLAHNRKVQDRQTQEWEERVSFFDVVSFGSLAENVSESLQRGDRIIVIGRLEQRAWETQEGEKRSKVEVIADAIGPEMRWASVAITKNAKREGGHRPPDDAYDEPGGHPAGRKGGGSRPARNEEPPAYDYDEEPF